IVGYFGFEQCLDGLFASLADPDERVRLAAVEHIPFLDDPRAAPAVERALADPAPRVRAAAARGAEQLEPAAILAALLGALADPDAWVRYSAARALGQMRAAAALEPLERLARRDPAFQVRIAALRALGRIGGEAAAATLLEFAAAGDAELARAALGGLGQARPPGGLPVILAALRAADPEQRIEAVQALAGYAVGEAESALQWTAAVDGDARVVQAAAGALAALQTPGAIQALIELLIDQSRRAAAQSALARLDDRHIPRIAAGLGHPAPAVRCASVAVLAQRTHQTAALLLPAALDDADPAVRLAAVAALAGRAAGAVRQRLSALAAADPDPAVRHAARAALR
ncbi:MAG TPA: HEAT repeat domain-containing protein, partial [Herpetosiphonaceae bacterium]|nr:HEAT repeat domain-containing protein [Herpetosiphonaceae bacterium]